MKVLTCLLLTLFLWAVFLAPPENYQQAVADAENSFARMSRETNTVNAFQHFLADDAVMFRDGEAVDGKKLWGSRKPDSTLLNWWPILADASKSGDLGYTTGPYQFFNRRSDQTPIGNGYYSTIWQKQSNGEWKIKLDLGVRLQVLKQLPTALIFADQPNITPTGSEATIKDVDNNYNSILSKSSVSVSEDFLLSGFRLHRPLIAPSVNETAAVRKAEEGIKFTFETLGGEKSASNDLAYSYGIALRSVNGDTRKANYLRVWKRDDSGEWRIVLDVVTEG
jgi:ketosteroid isomerase-like protein